MPNIPGSAIGAGLALALLVVGTEVQAQPPELLQAWNQPVSPVRLAGNVYYVGPNGVSAFLITTPEGHILLESGFAQSVPHIQASVERLGFRFADIRVLLSGHAHPDHVAGHAAVKRLTGATVEAMEQDAVVLEEGISTFPSAEREGMEWPAVKVDRRLRDGDTVSLGGVTLRALLTPGHTAGCTTWTTAVVESGRSLNVCFVGSFSINEGVRLAGNPEYPDRAQAYERTFEVLRALKCDVFLAEHPEAFGFADKVKRLGKGRNPFVDPSGYRRAVAEGRSLFLEQIKRERPASGR